MHFELSGSAMRKGSEWEIKRPAFEFRSRSLYSFLHKHYSESYEVISSQPQLWIKYECRLDSLAVVATSVWGGQIWIWNCLYPELGYTWTVSKVHSWKLHYKQEVSYVGVEATYMGLSRLECLETIGYSVATTSNWFTVRLQVETTLMINQHFKFTIIIKSSIS